MPLRTIAFPAYPRAVPVNHRTFLVRLATTTAAAASLGIALFTGGCAGTASVAPPPSPDILRIGVTPNAPPIVYRGPGGTYAGLEPQLGRKLAAEIGRRPHFVELPFEGLIPALQGNRIDIIMSGMSITDERKMRVAFAESYLGMGQILLVRNRDVGLYAYPAVIRVTSPRIGVEEGTTGDLYVQRMCPKAVRVPFKNPRSAAKALAEGEVDVVLHDMPVIMGLASEFETSGLVEIRKPVTLEYLAWGIRPGDNALLAEANAAVRRWKQSGELQGIVNAWIPVR